MLAVPGLWYIHEPFNPNKNIWKESFSYARPGKPTPAVDSYMQHLLNGRYRQTAQMAHCDHPLMPLRLFRPPIQRVMIKDPLACLLTGYLADRFPITPIVLFRHPAGFVSSVTRLGWPIGEYLKSFLKRDDLMQDHLEPYRQLMQQHQNRDDLAAATVLHGVLNTVQWNQIQANSGIRYYLFEDLCEDPINSFRQIFEHLQLPYDKTTTEFHEKLCSSGSENPADYHTHAVARNSKAMADSWKRQLAPDDTQMIRTGYQQFAIPFYQEDRDWDLS